MHEWPLVIFTLLMQLAIGCVITVWYCLSFSFQSLDVEKRRIIVIPALLCAFIIGCAGLLASTTHLGNPLHAMYTFNHLGSSWMSREILFTALFMALLFLTVAIVLIKKRLPIFLLAITALVGIVDIFAMSAIYDNSRFLLWNGWGTYAGFYGSALMMGSLLGAACMQSSLRKHSDNVVSLMTPLFRLYIVGILLATLAVIVMFAVSSPNLVNGITIKTMADNVEWLTVARSVLLMVSLLLLVNYVVRKRGELPVPVLTLALVITVTGEFLGRYAFFSVGG